jgi:Na+-translocating ferredoxin:NAD+ oxidoreductase subunit C
MAVVIEGNGDVGIEPLFQNRVPAEDAKAILKIIGEAGIEEVDPYPWPLPLRIAQPAVLPQGVSSNSPHLRRPIEFLIVNAIDRQPGVTLREKTLLREKKEISDAIGILQKVSGAKKTILAVSQDLSLQEDFVRSLSVNRVEIAKSPRKYPVALEPLLVQHLTGREMPQPEGDARAVGAVVVDVVTALQVLRAVRDGIPAVETTIQVFAPERGLDAIVRVRNGILLKEVLNHFSAVNGNTAKAVVGGPFLGYAQHSLEVPVTQRTDAVFLQEERELYSYANEPCINCGFCVRACPMGLQANEVGRFCEYGKFQAAEEIDLFHCIECGICAYVCPSKRPMLHLIRFGKRELSKQTASE